MDLLSQIIARAKACRQRIVLPEGDEPRTLEAANILLKDKKMSMKEVADYLGVTKYLVFNWWHERNYATQKNLDRLRDTVTKLNGREIRYPRQVAIWPPILELLN